jgi:hypothetical protein
MNKEVEIRANFIRKECGKKGVELLRSDSHEPVDFISLTNDRGDMASVSEGGAVFESASYVPEWSEELKEWAKAEGFSKKQVDSQNLIHNVTLEEAVGLLL